MRRFVDSLILVLVAYTVCWPVARSVMGRPDQHAPQTVVLHVGVAACDTSPRATVRVAGTEADAHAGKWLDQKTQHAGDPSVVLRVPHELETAWVSVDLPGATLPLREVALNGDDTPIEIATPPDLCIVVGTAAPTNRRVRVTVGACGEPVSFDVPCDTHGRFLFAVPEPGASIVAFESERGRRLGERRLPGSAGVHDVGNLPH